jgi:hypothetical protein
MHGMLSKTPSALHHICFDNDLAGRQFSENMKNVLHQQVRSAIIVTPERKPYLDSIPFNQDYANGNIDLLPKPLQDRYTQYESSWEEAMSMRDGRLSYEGDIKEQERKARDLYRDFRSELRSFLGIMPDQDTSFVREIPEKGKDWNEQLLIEKEDTQLSSDETDESRKVASGIDLDADGEIEVSESEEKKQFHKVRR